MKSDKYEAPVAERASMDRLRLELKRASGPFLLFMLLMVAGIFTGADIIRNLAGDKPWVKYSTYKVAFTDTKGVVPGRVELRIAGVKAGSIKGNDLVNGQAVLTLHLEKKYAPLYRDAKIRIRPVTALEDMYVDIESRGHPSAGVLPGNEILPAQRTVSPVEVGTILDQLDKGTRANIASLLDNLGRGLSDRGASLRMAFAELAPFLKTTEQMSSALAERRQNLARLIHNFGGITGEMADHDRQLASFVKGANATLGQLAHDDGPFASTIAQLPSTLQTMRSSFANLRQTEDTLDPALRALQPVASSLPDGLDALTHFSREATPALVALRPSARSLKPLATTLQPTSKSLRDAFGLLKTEAPQMDLVTKQAAVPKCRLITEQFLNRIMSITKYGYGAHNMARARADVRIDFNSAGSVVRDPQWRVAQPCTAPLTQIPEGKR